MGSETYTKAHEGGTKDDQVSRSRHTLSHLNACGHSASLLLTLITEGRNFERVYILLRTVEHIVYTASGILDVEGGIVVGGCD